MNWLKQIFTKKQSINIPSYVRYVYYRFTYNCKHLKKKDFVSGFGMDSSHYRKVCDARAKYNELNPDNKLPLHSDFKELYDNRIGHYIDMTKIDTKYHPYHFKQLIEVKTGKRYVIDTVSIQNHYGKTVVLGCRQEGSRSHMHIIWENISSFEPNNIKSAKQNQKRFIMVDRLDPWHFC